jgi:hypothetical protein
MAAGFEGDGAFDGSGGRCCQDVPRQVEDLSTISGGHIHGTASAVLHSISKIGHKEEKHVRRVR